jgi:MEMO1 family protein
MIPSAVRRLSLKGWAAGTEAAVSEETIPALRPVELVPITHEGHRLFLLRDPAGIAAEAIVLPPASVELLAFFDGDHTLRDVQTSIARATGRIVPLEQIGEFVGTLDRNHFLLSPAFEERRRELAREYATAPARAAHFAGQAYAAEVDPLRRELDALFDAPGGPGRPVAPVARRPVAIAAPHIDPARGGAVYAHAYASLWGARPERVVILGVLHGASANPFVVTAKDYETPLGRLRTDARRVHALAERLGWDPLEEEELHRAEHSIEFQALLLQHALTEGGTREPDPELEVLPILCAFSWEDFRETLAAAARRARIDAFLQTLRTLLGEDPTPTLIVAGVDLTHAGPRFGDTREPSAAWQEELRRRDGATLERLAAGDAAGFVREIVSESDERRLCGFGALYALHALCAPVRGRLLHYDQCVDRSGIVSFAALAFEESS